MRHHLDIIGDIVAATATALNTTITYLYGSVEEITESLLQLGQHETTAATKYPLFCVVTDIQESKGNESSIFTEFTPAAILIACDTLPTLKAIERKAQSFEAVLIPIYEEFLRQMYISPLVTCPPPAKIEHTKIERYRWGRNQITTENGTSVDYIDAIELNNLTFKIQNQKSCQ